ncbi:Glutaminyl-tRNA synthetase [Conglomerata obtusa]
MTPTEDHDHNSNKQDCSTCVRSNQTQNKSHKIKKEIKSEEKHINEIDTNASHNKRNDKVTVIDDYAWLKEGELSKIHTPFTNPLNTPEILESHLKRTKGSVITRFPPEPNGFLHIGHAKALNLSYEFSKLHGGRFILRFDDTNPKNELAEYYNSIEKDVQWLLGAKELIKLPNNKTDDDNSNNKNNTMNNIDNNDSNTNITSNINNDSNNNNEDANNNIINDSHGNYVKTYASDYFQEFINFGKQLIKKGKAFVCHQSKEEIKKFREENRDSPFRNRSVEMNLFLFEEMIQGKHKEGSISLRMKMNMQSKNPLMHDLIAFRVIEEKHSRTGDKFKVYPSYDFTHCINDSLEDITHSFCSREFFLRKESYCWLLDELNLYKPVQWEFTRLNIQGTVLSKRKITELIKTGVVCGWNDPRLYTLCGLRRRGFTPSGINNFVKKVGITFSESVIEKKSLENCVRDDLNVVSKKINCVIEPIKIKLNEEIYFIEKSDFLDEPNFENESEVINKNDMDLHKKINYKENKIKSLDTRKDSINDSNNNSIINENINDKDDIKNNDGNNKDDINNNNNDAKSVDGKNLSGKKLSGKNATKNQRGIKKKEPIFLRLTKNQPVGLLYLACIKYVGRENDCILVEECNEKPKKYIHWVKEGNYTEIEVRIFDDLFIETQEKNIIENNNKFFDNILNPISLVIKKGYCENEIKDCKIGSHLQFRRVGFFCVDEVSTRENIVVNLTLPLRNPTWK